MQATTTLERPAQKQMARRLILRYWNPGNQRYEVLSSRELDELSVVGSARTTAHDFLGGFLEPLRKSEIHPHAPFVVDGIEYHSLLIEFGERQLKSLAILARHNFTMTPQSQHQFATQLRLALPVFPA